MSEVTSSPFKSLRAFKQWFFEGQVKEVAGAHRKEGQYHQTGQLPHVYFGWTEGNPLVYVLKFIFFGEGDTAPVTHETLRQAEHERSKRPAVLVGG